MACRASLCSCWKRALGNDYGEATRRDVKDQCAPIHSRRTWGVQRLGASRTKGLELAGCRAVFQEIREVASGLSSVVSRNRRYDVIERIAIIPTHGLERPGVWKTRMVEEFFFKLTPAYVLPISIALRLISFVDYQRNPGDYSPRDPVPFGVK